MSILGAILESPLLPSFAVVLGIVLLGREYMSTMTELSKQWPRIVAISYFFGAIFYGILSLLIVFEWEKEDHNQYLGGRTTFFFSAATMILGPFLVFTPMKPIQLKSKSVFNSAVEVSHAKATRYISLFLFTLVTILQGVAIYNLWVFMDGIGIQIEQRLGAVIMYILISGYYLLIFYSLMLKKTIIVNDIDVVNQLRQSITFERKGRTFHLLSSKLYVIGYLIVFVLVVLGIIAAFALTLRLEIREWPELSAVDRVGFITLSVGNVVTMVVYCVTVLQVSFNPVRFIESVKTKKETIPMDTVLAIVIANYHEEILISKFTSRAPLNEIMKDVSKTLHSSLSQRIEKAHTKRWGILHQKNDEKLAFFVATSKNAGGVGASLAVSLSQHIQEEEQVHSSATTILVEDLLLKFNSKGVQVEKKQDKAAKSQDFDLLSMEEKKQDKAAKSQDFDMLSMEEKASDVDFPSDGALPAKEDKEQEPERARDKPSQNATLSPPPPPPVPRSDSPVPVPHYHAPILEPEVVPIMITGGIQGSSDDDDSPEMEEQKSKDEDAYSEERSEQKQKITGEKGKRSPNMLFKKEKNRKKVEEKERPAAPKKEERVVHKIEEEGRQSTISPKTPFMSPTRDLSKPSHRATSQFVSRPSPQSSLVALENGVIPSSKVEIGKTLGQGAASSVYKAMVNGTIVIAATISQDQLSDVNQLKQFVALCVSKVAHSHVIRVLGIVLDSSTPLLLSEMCETDLFSWISSGRSYGVIKLLKEIAAGLLYIHNELGIAHPDMSLSQLYLTGDMSIKVGGYEWGFKDNSGRSAEPFLGGPEGVVSKKSNVFTFGWIAVLLLNKSTRPFPDVNQFKAMIDVAKADDSVIPANCPPKLKEVIQLCWQQDPNQRPTFETIIQKLGGIQEVQQ